MDVIYLHNLRVETVIGVWDWERRIRQNLLIDIDLGTDVSRAGETDDIADTVDYKAVSDRVISFTAGSEFRLIEALADRIAAIVLEEFDVKWIRVQINKQGVVRHVRDIGVIIERGERD
jgi:7,8-dihydroneopterin aldolase/epimerase/oxygenase